MEFWVLMLSVSLTIEFEMDTIEEIESTYTPDADGNIIA